MRPFVLVLLLAYAPYALGQSSASVSGFVTDAASEETLLLANVLLEGTSVGTATNNTGYYTLTGLAPGTYTVVASYIGYQTLRVEVTLAPNEKRRLDLALRPDDYTIDEVTVTADREDEEEIRRLGSAQIQTAVIKRLPAVLEPDVFRSLQLLPGVKAASDYSSGLYIRGGSPDQTLILLDRTTVYNPSHFFGFFSTFNPDAIKDVRLYKGAYPAEYGGRLGSVVDIYNKDGNRREREGSLSLGLLATRAMVEGPYSKGSAMLAVRRSTLEPLLAALRAAEVEGIPSGFYFYDVNGKVNYDASQNDRLSLSGYAGRDVLDIEIFGDADVHLLYGNRTLSGNWTHIFSQRLFSNFTLTGSRYFSEPTFEVGGTSFRQANGVTDYSVKGDLEFIPNPRHTFEAGFWSGRFNVAFRNVFDDQVTLNEEIESLYGSGYLQYAYRPTPVWQLLGGLRLSYYSSGHHARLEPRLSIEHQPAPGLRLQAGYGRYAQYLTLITSELFSGFDAWLTTGEGVPPSYGDQFVVGAKADIGAGIAVDVESYYRTMHQLFEFDPFLQDVAGLAYDRLFRFGDGYAYGLEVLLQKPDGRLNGFVGYTWGRTRRRYEAVNEGRYYPPKYDRTHDVNVVANFDLTRSWRLTSVWTYATGQAYTRPHARFALHDYPLSDARFDLLVSNYNHARLPAYHRLDVGAARRGRFFGFADYELQIQVINLYNRRNVWFYFYEFGTDEAIERTEVPQIPVPLPNLSLTLNF